jgi:eukaryotic-like serine/threonine-protein kinase
MQLRAGARLSHFELERLIGSGGTSQVWAARDERSGDRVALKLLTVGENIDELSHVRFAREAHASRSIGHPAVVPVREALEHDGMPVLVMDLLQGETLREVLHRERALSLAHTASVLGPIAEALQRAHALGIVHRDLKPENIFVQSQGSPRVRLLDFGVARFSEPPPGTEGAPVTALGTLVGTLAYMAPEQAMNPSGSDHRVDIWALGVILYEALSGCRPIEGNTGPEILRQLLVGAITPIEVLSPDVPSEVAALISSMLVRAPDRRLADVERVTAVLHGYAERV